MNRWGGVYISELKWKFIIHGNSMMTFNLVMIMFYESHCTLSVLQVQFKCVWSPDVLQFFLMQGDSGSLHLQGVQLKIVFPLATVFLRILADNLLSWQSWYFLNIWIKCSVSEFSDLIGIAGWTFLQISKIGGSITLISSLSVFSGYNTLFRFLNLIISCIDGGLLPFKSSPGGSKKDACVLVFALGIFLKSKHLKKSKTTLLTWFKPLNPPNIE